LTSPTTLLGYFRAAQARFGVPWEDLAAIEFIETRFGRVQGLSPAGAQGPMQFMAATWARYGSGQVDNQRDAIFGAARYLDANGAPGDMAGALYHYNDSRDYVQVANDYASRMRADIRAYYGYYDWQVVYARVGGTVILPVGYPNVRPVPVALPSQG
jgi:membrane-bound lytic murein transglycosylase B